MAASLDLPDIDKGATYRHTLFWKNKLKAPIDLTSVSARMQVRDDVDSPIVRLDLRTVNGGLVIDPLIGRIDIYISSDDTASLYGYGGVYDMELVFPTGDIVRLIEGSINFIPEVTR
jgi:hypothetical protein